MKNPLTKDEKISVRNIIGHDVASHLVDIPVNQETHKFSKREIYSKCRHVKKILESIDLLLRDDCMFLRTYKHDIDSFLSDIQAILKEEGELSVTNNLNKRDEFQSFDSLLYTSLLNLAKNSLRIAGQADIIVSESQGINPSGLVYTPKSDLNGYHVRFTVHDKGLGFPKDRPLEEFLNLGVTTKDNGIGFGLHYLRLVAKYLRAPITIQSEPGNTTISLYHPIDLED